MLTHVVIRTGKTSVALVITAVEALSLATDPGTPRPALCCFSFPLRLKSLLGQVMSEMEVDQELEVFRHLLPSLAEKRQRENPAAVERETKTSKHSEGKGKGSRRGGRGAKSKEKDPDAQVPLTPLLKAIAQLALRHEDALCLLNLDKGFVLHQRTKAPESLLDQMYQQSTQWRKSKEEGTVTSPLCVILLKCFLMELLARMTKAMQTESALTGMIKLQWAQKSEMGAVMWNYFRYDAETKKEVLDQDKQPMGGEALLQDMQKAITLLSAETLHRFHATRPMAEHYESENISFLIQVSLRGENAQFLHQHLGVLSHCAAVFLMGAKIRPEKIQRSALAQRIAELLR